MEKLNSIKKLIVICALMSAGAEVYAENYPADAPAGITNWTKTWTQGTLNIKNSTNNNITIVPGYAYQCKIGAGCGYTDQASSARSGAQPITVASGKSTNLGIGYGEYSSQNLLYVNSVNSMSVAAGNSSLSYQLTGNSSGISMTHQSTNVSSQTSAVDLSSCSPNTLSGYSTGANIYWVVTAKETGGFTCKSVTEKDFNNAAVIGSFGSFSVKNKTDQPIQMTGNGGFSKTISANSQASVSVANGNNDSYSFYLTDKKYLFACTGTGDTVTISSTPVCALHYSGKYNNQQLNVINQSATPIGISAGVVNTSASAGGSMALNVGTSRNYTLSYYGQPDFKCSGSGNVAVITDSCTLEHSVLAS